MATTDAPRSLLDLPHALNAPNRLGALIGDRTVAVFLDYDGTLTPIVDDPDAAVLSDPARQAIARLAEVVPVAVVSGRDRADVESRVGLADLIYAGSHGFDIAGPGWTHRHPGGAEAQPALAAAASSIEAEIGAVPGAIVERKAYAVAVHFRMVEPGLVPTIDAAVDAALAAYPGLRRTTGKMIFELRPDVAWDKGAALLFLLDHLHLNRPDVAPIYVGDDDTDEDALRVVATVGAANKNGPARKTTDGGGVGVIVGREPRPTWAHLRLSSTDETVVFLDRLSRRFELR